MFDEINPCAFCVLKFQYPCQLCPEWPEELLNEDMITSEFLAERARLTTAPPLVAPLFH